MNEYLVSVDIAKKRDYTAILTFQHAHEILDGVEALGIPDRIGTFLVVRKIERFHNLPYQEISDAIEYTMGNIEINNNADLLIDGTGVGAAVVDLVNARGLAPIPIIFTGGQAVREVYLDMGTTWGQGGALNRVRPLKEIHVPKLDLVDAGRLMVEQKRIKCSKSIQWADKFRQELIAFRGKVNEAGKVRFEAEGESDHDDMLVCLLMAAWFTQRTAGIDPIKERRIILDKDITGKSWEPSDNF